MLVNIIDGRKEKNFDDSVKVLIDVFRSTTTLPLMLYKKAEYIIPVRTITETRKLKEKNPQYITSGERYGIRIPGFNYDNSPYAILNSDLSNKIVLFTSTNGIKVLYKIMNYPGKIYLSSFVNFNATYNAIKNYDKISLIVSNRPDGKSDEDYIYADMLENKLNGNDINIDEYKEKIRKSRGSRRLRIMGASKDIEISLNVDLYNYPIIYNDGKIITDN